MCERKKRIQQYKSLINAFADPCDDTIYHYTSSEGIRGIIEKSELWLSNASFVNDTTECSALQQTTELFDSSNLKNEYVRKRWEAFTKSPDKSNDTYIASFSRGEESLDQWRAYGAFRIGFDAKRLAKRPFNLYQCIYNTDEIKRWILEKSELDEWRGDCLNDQLKRGAAWSIIYAASRKFKNNYFENERETRLLVVSHPIWGPFENSPSMYEDEPPIHYRDHAGYNLPVPYVKFYLIEEEGRGDHQGPPSKESYFDMKERKLKEEKKKRKLLPITEIMIGPMRHQDEAELACEILLNDQGYRDVTVNVSSIPYRGV
jgi:hypothetical protein